MANTEKAKVQRWIKQGMASLFAANKFFEDFDEYAMRVKDPSLLAMTGPEATELLKVLRNAHGMYSGRVQLMLRERVRISELQGSYSLQRKRELKEQRATT